MPADILRDMLVSLIKGFTLTCWNQIGDAGLSALAGALSSRALASLEVLNLRGNQIGDAGLSALAAAVGEGELATRELALGEGVAPRGDLLLLLVLLLLLLLSFRLCDIHSAIKTTNPFFLKSTFLVSFRVVEVILSTVAAGEMYPSVSRRLTSTRGEVEDK
jgi:hypothetical protein